MPITKKEFEDKYRPCNFLDMIKNKEIDRTLIFGYELNRSTTHIYLKDGLVYYYNYENESIDFDLCRKIKNISENDIPSKRVYPESSDLDFLKLLQMFDIDVCFTTYSEERYEKIKDLKFQGEVC